MECPILCTAYHARLTSNTLLRQTTLDVLKVPADLGRTK
jgi:hypothetical protein